MFAFSKKEFGITSVLRKKKLDSEFKKWLQKSA